MPLWLLLALTTLARPSQWASITKPKPLALRVLPGTWLRAFATLQVDPRLTHEAQSNALTDAYLRLRAAWRPLGRILTEGNPMIDTYPPAVPVGPPGRLQTAFSIYFQRNDAISTGRAGDFELTSFRTSQGQYS